MSRKVPVNLSIETITILSDLFQQDNVIDYLLSFQIPALIEFGVEGLAAVRSKSE